MAEVRNVEMQFATLRAYAPRWEYLVKPICVGLDVVDFNAFGRERWELVTITSQVHFQVAYFKRRVADEDGEAA
jgi:hypothetical protein